MQEKIIDLLCEVMEDPTLKERINGDSDITKDVGLSSLQLINFILKIEDELKISIDFDEFDLEKLNSINTFCDFISEKVKT
jgi:acyl carrier protein